MDPSRPPSWRVRFDDPALGDFVVLRSDGLFSYQLAVVVDDAAQQITHVVRGADLFDSTPWQNWLQKLLGYLVPVYRHVPIATNAAGEKLSKQTGAEPLNPRPRTGVAASRPSVTKPAGSTWPNAARNTRHRGAAMAAALYHRARLTAVI
jgi:glutamyl/glutaminyl-tRNA synthetase